LQPRLHRWLESLPSPQQLHGQAVLVGPSVLGPSVLVQVAVAVVALLLWLLQLL